MSLTGHGWAASCHPLAARPQRTQSHTAGPASLIMGPQRPELEQAGQRLTQALPDNLSGLRRPSQQASAHLIHSKAEAQGGGGGPLPKLGRDGSEIQIQVVCSTCARPGCPSTLDSDTHGWTTPACGADRGGVGESSVKSSSWPLLSPLLYPAPTCSPLHPFLLSPKPPWSLVQGSCRF